MFCQKCGKEISDTVKFCAFCGAPVEGSPIPAMPVIPIETVNFAENAGTHEEKMTGDDQIDEDATVVLTNSVKKSVSPQEIGEQGKREQRMPVIPVVSAPNPGAQIPVSPKKKFPMGALLVGLVGIAAVILIAFVLKGIFAGGNKDFFRVAYMKDDKLCVISNMDVSDPENIELIKIKDASGFGSYWSLAKFSDDGSYLYYFSKIDTEKRMGTLCRIPTAKLTNDESKNEQLEEEIDKKVSLDSYRIIDNTTVIYVKSGSKLLYYVDGEAYELTDALGSSYYYDAAYDNGGYDYYITEDKMYVVYCNEEKELYIQKLEQNSEPEKIDNDINYFCNSPKNEFIVYSKDYDEENTVRDLYVAGIDKKPELVAEDVFDFTVDGENSSIYYYVKATEKIDLISYVYDPYAEQDMDVKEPENINFFATERNYPELSEDDNGEYTQEEFMRMISYDYDYTFDMNYYYNYDNGKTYYYNQDNEKWYTDFDNEKYEQALEDYTAAMRRQKLREELTSAEPVNDYYIGLYYYKDGKNREICDSVLEAASCEQGIIYTKKEAGKPGKTYDINEIGSVDDLKNRIQFGGGTEGGAEEEKDQKTYFCTIRGHEGTEVTDFEEIFSLHVFEDGKKAVISGDRDEEGTYLVIAYDVSDSGLGKGETVSKEGTEMQVKENSFYYYENVDKGEGDLYSYDGSEPKLIAKDIWIYTGFAADDGTLAGYTDWDENKGDLRVYGEKGKGERIAKNVESFRYLGSGAYLIIKENDLYYLNKEGEEIRLAKDVAYFWYPGDLLGFFI